MAYGDFSLPTLLQKFSLETEEREDYFASTSPIELSQDMLDRIKRQAARAIAVSTEKARSEFIIAPLLLEALEHTDQVVSFFSGIELSPAPELGLNGVCDFLFSLSPSQILMTAPIVAIVEAKNDNVRFGFEQCIAEMVASQIYNQQKKSSLSTYYGVSTTGTNWIFMRLVGQTIFIDRTEYYISDPEKLVGIVVRMLEEAGRDFKARLENG